MALYDPERHEIPSGARWDEGLARAAIARIVDDANAAFTPEGLWPIHPLDVSPERPPDCLKALYNGAAGVIWALRRLAREGAAPLALEFGPTVRDLIERSREDLRRHETLRDYMAGAQSAYLIGETGLRLLEWTLSPSPAIEQALHEAIAATVGDVRGVVWGGPGAMLAALFLYERSGEARWRDLFDAHAEALWAAWSHVPEAGCHLWNQTLYGQTGPLLGALHGFAANACALLRGRALIAPPRLREIETRTRAALVATAVREGTAANWPMGARPTSRTNVDMLLLQHCFGAPGMIQCLAALPPDPETDALMLAAGDLVWRAGPTTKPPGLCHGAPGSGYALLKLHTRTADPVWLERARAFAMHAVLKSDRAAAEHGQRKWSLWTGDAGVAVYLWDCITGTAEFPMLDAF